MIVFKSKKAKIDNPIRIREAPIFLNITNDNGNMRQEKDFPKRKIPTEANTKIKIPPTNSVTNKSMNITNAMTAMRNASGNVKGREKIASRTAINDFPAPLTVECF